jgi:hypothetical protein
MALIDLGDGIKRPVLRQIEHDGGFIEYVIGRHRGQVRDGRTLSLYTAPFLAALYPSLAEAREAAGADKP